MARTGACGRIGQQSPTADRARQISRVLLAARRPARSVRTHWGTSLRLSNDATHVSFNPSSGPRATSVGMWRMVRVTGATRRVRSRGIAASRVTTSAGRRPASGISAHQTSPWAGRLTKALRRSSPAPKPRRRQPPRHPAAAVDSRQRSPRRPVAAARPRPAPRRPVAPPRRGSRSARHARARPRERRQLHQGGPPTGYQRSCSHGTTGTTSLGRPGTTPGGHDATHPEQDPAGCPGAGPGSPFLRPDPTPRSRRARSTGPFAHPTSD